MKKNKAIIAILLIAVIVATTFVACSSKKQYNDKEVEVSQAVTDENGEAVTDSNGEVVTEKVTAVVVTDANGQTVTEYVTKNDGTVVTKPNGEKVSQVVTTIPDKTQSKPSDKDKTPSDEGSSKNKGDKTSTSKKNDGKDKPTKPTNKPIPEKPTKEDDTTTTTEPPTNLEDEKGTTEEADEKDCTATIILPFFSADDAMNYELVVTIKPENEKDKDVVLKQSFVGCKGQQIVVAIPKEYKGLKAVFSVNVRGKDYAIEKTIRKHTSVQFEKIIIMEGEDD